jgi:GNAT superfamily N-acetyltransferase
VSEDRVRIAPAGPVDLPALAALMARSPLLGRYGVTRDAALTALEAGHRAGDLLLVGQASDGVPLGLAWVIGSRILTGAAYLRLLLIADGEEGHGLGARLLSAAEAEARGWANHLVLLATTDNAGARRFYERHGYRHVGDLPDLARPGLGEALYFKTLRSHADRLSL